MAKFGTTSWKRLRTCHTDWQVILSHVIRYIDFSVLEGHRNQQKQDEYFGNGTSRVKFPYGSHNSNPSMGVDVAPYPEIYDDKEKCYLLAGFILQAAKMLLEQGKITHEVRWGGDWNGNLNMKDQSFFDLVHFELKEPK